MQVLIQHFRTDQTVSASGPQVPFLCRGDASNVSRATFSLCLTSDFLSLTCYLK